MKIKITEIKEYLKEKGDELDCENHFVIRKEIENGYDHHMVCVFCKHILTRDELNDRT
jgi:S-adenosylmethionine synthetase